MEISFIFRFLAAIKYLHWSTKSYAEHKALDDAYKALNENIDKFVEAYSGLNPNKKFTLSDISFKKDPRPQDFSTTLEFFNALSHDFLNEIEKYNDTSSLTSIIDDIENCCYQTKYLLKLN